MPRPVTSCWTSSYGTYQKPVSGQSIDVDGSGATTFAITNPPAILTSALTAKRLIATN
jgi:hypothetical protein